MMQEKSVRLKKNIVASLKISARENHKKFYAHVVEEGGNVTVTRYLPDSKMCVVLSAYSKKAVLHKRHLASCALNVAISQLH